MRGKSWDELSPAYRARLSKNGINADTFAEAKRTGQLEKARGHGETPERPERAQKEKNRERYKDYLERRRTLENKVIARKDLLFGDTHKYNLRGAKQRSIDAVHKNPVTRKPPKIKAMRDFLAHSESYGDFADWWDDVKDDDDYAFVFYH